MLKRRGTFLRQDALTPVQNDKGGKYIPFHETQDRFSTMAAYFLTPRAVRGINTEQLENTLNLDILNLVLDESVIFDYHVYQNQGNACHPLMGSSGGLRCPSPERRGSTMPDRVAL